MMYSASPLFYAWPLWSRRASPLPPRSPALLASPSRSPRSRCLFPRVRATAACVISVLGFVGAFSAVIGPLASRGRASAWRCKILFNESMLT
ncbi:hypothetical protein EJB05_09556, partial [Eragrostis curvula]